MQPQPTVTVFATPASAPAPNDDKFRPAALTQMKVLSILQIIAGGICIVFGITLKCLDEGYVQDIVYGVWIGVYFILVGGIGLGAVKANSSCWITSAMVLNILCSSFVSFLLLTFAAVGLAQYEGWRYAYDCYDYYRYSSFSRAVCDTDLINTFTALNSIMIILAVAEFIITIWCAVLCCGAVCRCCKPTGGQIVQTTTVAMNQPQMVTYTAAAPGGVGYPAGQPMPVQQGQYYPMAMQPQPMAMQQQPMAMQQQPVGYVAQPPHQPQPQPPPGYYPPAKGDQGSHNV